MKLLWLLSLPLAALLVTHGPLALFVGAAAAAAAGLATFQITGARRIATLASLVAPLGAAWPAAGLAGLCALGVIGLRWRTGRPHWALALLPLVLLEAPWTPIPQLAGALGPGAAWLWAASLASPMLLAERDRPWIGLAAALPILALEPAVGATAVVAGLVARLASLHPANASWHRGTERAAPILLTLPPIVLLVVAIGRGLAEVPPLGTLRLGFEALGLGLLLTLALLGTAPLFLASDRPAPTQLAFAWSSWSVAAVLTLVNWTELQLSVLGAGALATSPLAAMGIGRLAGTARVTPAAVVTALSAGLLLFM